MVHYVTVVYIFRTEHNCKKYDCVAVVGERKVRNAFIRSILLIFVKTDD